uniref:Uncharacterized protein n=1 Tax=Myotis myotis TaxID=51298 RepID=A0A7J7XI10_MYOMY|nr:hypothetical protein mMyoMyo1_011714 [Myotis myotis]
MPAGAGLVMPLGAVGLWEAVPARWRGRRGPADDPKAVFSGFVSYEQVPSDRPLSGCRKCVRLAQAYLATMQEVGRKAWTGAQGADSRTLASFVLGCCLAVPPCTHCLRFLLKMSIVKSDIFSSFPRG